jgi:hypothetical protein
MKLVRIAQAKPLDAFRVQLTLTDGSAVEKDLAPFLTGPVFEAIRSDAAFFHQMKVEAGTLVWPNGADLCPDAILWNGLPPLEDEGPPATVEQPREQAGR